MSQIKLSGLIVLLMGLAIYMLYIYYIGFDEVWRMLSSIGLLEISLFMLLSLVVIFLHSFAWYLLIRGYSAENNIRFTDVFGIIVIALFSGYVIPIGGVTEIIRIALSVIKYRLRSSVAISSIIMHRLYVSSSALIIFFIVFILRAYFRSVYTLSFGELIIISAYTILVVLPNISILGIMSTDIFKRILDRFKYFMETKIVKKKISFEPEIFMRDYTSYLRKSIFSINSVLAYVISIAEWFFLSLAVYILVYGFISKLQDPIYAVMSAIIFQMIYWILPLSFIGSIGIAEFIMTLALQIIGLSPYLATSLVILYRTITFLTIVLLYYPIMKISKIEDLSKIVREGIDMIYSKTK
ncbi:MAG: lysylphosphatidylglycerol synthase transmembrane domain-containing protein [Sulfolobales archaeon]